MPRNLADVLDRVLAVVPQSETVLREELARVKFDASFRPPELQWMDWDHVGKAFGRHIGDPPFSSQWQERVQRIWLDRENEREDTP